MRAPRPLPDEEARLLALSEYGFEAQPGEPSLDPIVALAAQMFDVPMAVVNLIDREHVFFASARGIGDDLDPALARREVSFCAHAITQEEPLVVADATIDPRFFDNPLVTGPTQFRFYAGVPLRGPEGHGLGAFCIIDTRARTPMSEHDLQRLEQLASLVLDKLELRRLEVARRASQDRFEHIAATSPDAILCADSDGKITVWNAAAERMFGFSAEMVIGEDVAMIVPEALRDRLYDAIRPSTADPSAPLVGKTTELQGLRADGSVFPTEFSLSAWQENGAATYGAIIRDITERRRNEDELYRLAHHDQLTSLPNRGVLTRRIDETLKSGAPAAVVLLDLDGFKIINDTLGHAVGDELLRQVADRLGGVVRSIDTVSRLGGDEFALLLNGVGDPLRAASAAEAAIGALQRPFVIEGHDVHVGASAGIALAPAHAATADELVSNADLALYQAKAEGGGTRRLFMASMRQAAIARRQHDVEIRRAIDNMELELFYQPQVRLSDNALMGAEALLRWRHPERGVLTPAAFMQALDGGILAATVGEWALESACKQAAKWRKLNTDFRIGVNLFGAQFRADDLAADVCSALERTGLPADALELEITENIILNHDEAVVTPLKKLRELGVHVAFDDYGTGYASLSLLKRYPITRLKIDQSFVRNMCGSEEDEAVIAAVLYLGQRFQVDVIAEGIETPEQALALARLGCLQGQGYLFGRPVPATEFQARFLETDAGALVMSM